MTNTPREWEKEAVEIAWEFARDNITPPRAELLFRELIRTIEDKAREAERERVRKLVEGMHETFNNLHGHDSEECATCAYNEGRVDGHNQALSDILTALNEKKSN